MRDETLRYISACEYACEVLGVTLAERYFDRLHRLSEVNTPDELSSIIRSWRQPDAAPPSPRTDSPWAIGAKWGDSVRVVRDRGIVWKLKCPCGQLFDASTGDTVPPEKRKCPNCVLTDDFSDAKRELVFKLEQVSKIILEWHGQYQTLVWSRVHKTCGKRGINNADFARELNALVWAKIAEVAGRYDPNRAKVSTWLYRVVDNCLKDYFKVNANRERLAPTVPLIADGRGAAAPPTRPEEVLPAKAVRAAGAVPDGKGVTNSAQATWDKAQGWNG